MRDAKRKSIAATKQQSAQSFLATAWYRRLHEGFLIALMAIGVFFLLSLATYHRVDPSWSHQIDQTKIINAGGRVGAWLSDFLLYVFGYTAYLFPIFLLYGVYLLYRHQPTVESKNRFRFLPAFLRVFSFVLVIVSATGLLNLYLPAKMNLLPYEAGGIIGEVVGDSVLHWFNQLGATVFLTPLFLISVSSLTGASWLQIIDGLGAQLQRGFVLFKKYCNQAFFSRMHFKINATERLTPVNISPVFSKALLTSPKSFLSPSAIAIPEENAYMSAPKYSQSTVLPKLNLLDDISNERKPGLSQTILESRSHEVEQRLQDFGVEAKVVAIHPGPVVTRFELSLAAGTKGSKISSLVKDLARSFSVTSVRVVEVIPGKSVIGLELPNPNREVVTLKEVLSTKVFQQSRSSLTLALGKDIAGESVVVDLAKMPHLLVAGTTGAGKSVALNAMLLSLLYKSSPQDLRLILIDPKMLELAVYDGIPHLLAPVVTDMR